ncbi:MAG: hypothetical protein IT382_20685 [Deltaproteobacteria bacterium]|nr:hypothetical protein [Deltaproteobacteria bacterium]
MLVLLAALLVTQAPDPANDPAPAPAEPAPAEPAPTEPAPAEPGSEPGLVENEPADVPAPAPASASELAACAALLAAGDTEAARACYAAQASNADAARAALASELADLVGSLELPQPAEELAPPAPAPFDLGLLATSGKAELIASSALAGGYAAELAAITLVVLGQGLGGGGPLAGLLLLAPVGGGIAGLATATALVLAVPQLGAGDANALRAFLLLGGFNSVMSATTLSAYVGGSIGNSGALPAAMLAALSATTGAGVAMAVLLDLPEGAGAAAISGAIWTPLLSMLVVNMFEGLKGDSRAAIPLIAVTGNLGFAGGMALASTVLPASRAETWALDIGGAVGVLGGAALALGLRAPNPFLGYGTMAAGCALGMAAGVGAARLGPAALDALPQVVAVAPLAAPPLGAGPPPVGVALAGRF